MQCFSFLFTQFLVLVTLGATTLASAQSNCDQLVKLNEKETAAHLRAAEKKDIGSLMFQLGECKAKNSVQALVKYLGDPRISHETRHKGMSYRYMASVALGKITGLKVSVRQDSPDAEYERAVADWKQKLGAQQNR